MLSYTQQVTIDSSKIFTKNKAEYKDVTVLVGEVMMDNQHHYSCIKNPFQRVDVLDSDIYFHIHVIGVILKTLK